MSWGLVCKWAVPAVCDGANKPNDKFTLSHLKEVEFGLSDIVPA